MRFFVPVISHTAASQSELGFCVGNTRILIWILDAATPEEDDFDDGTGPERVRGSNQAPPSTNLHRGRFAGRSGSELATFLQIAGG